MLKNKRIKLVADPDDKEMTDLIKSAHINVVYSLIDTGIKLKLLYSLYLGRFCIVNKIAVQGNELNEICKIVSEKYSLNQLVTNSFNQVFTLKEVEERKQILLKEFDNYKNAQSIFNLI